MSNHQQISTMSLATQMPGDQAPTIELTSRGGAGRLMAPLAVAEMPLRWDRPTSRLGRAEPKWARVTWSADILVRSSFPENVRFQERT
jgi:hypothetical protein